jgi:hypothetical protein
LNLGGHVPSAQLEKNEIPSKKLDTSCAANPYMHAVKESFEELNHSAELWLKNKQSL